jgi:hypothetical protein
MATKKWLVGQPRFYKGMTKDENSGDFFVNEADYLGDLPLQAVVFLSEELRKITDKNGKLWSEVLYKNKKGEEVKGWLMDGFLEDVVESPNLSAGVVPIPNATPDPTDPAQFMEWDSKTVTKTNMCSELCVAFIGGDDIVTFLRKWEKHDNVFYPWAVKGNSNKPLMWFHIDKMLEVYGYPKHNLKLKDGLTDPGIGFAPTPGRFKKMLETCYLIANVRIDSSGKLVSKENNQGVGHWVVLDKITPYGVNRGRVEIYNPYPNRREEYSYADFIRSCAPTYTGLWVSRDRPSIGVSDTISFRARPQN